MHNVFDGSISKIVSPEDDVFLCNVMQTNRGWFLGLSSEIQYQAPCEPHDL